MLWQAAEKFFFLAVLVLRKRKNIKRVFPKSKTNIDFVQRGVQILKQEPPTATCVHSVFFYRKLTLWLDSYALHKQFFYLHRRGEAM